MFRLLRLVLIPLFLVGLPLFIYLGFIADEPVLDVEYDVELGRHSAKAILEERTPRSFRSCQPTTTRKRMGTCGASCETWSIPTHSSTVISSYTTASRSSKRMTC